MRTPLTHLGDMPVATFLAEYWQKKPLLVRQAFPGFQSPVTPETLAGFSLEQGVESRLVVETPGDGNGLTSHWQLRHGPFHETDFQHLPSRFWSLLVQAVDQMVPEVAELMGAFRFLPNWRLDDIMVSYAEDGGGVGPHFDYYDVFLLQAEGQRRWKLGQYCDTHTPLRNDTELKLLTRFDEQAIYTLEPGDLLYIPPRRAHWGTAIGPCMTYSVGFRAPSFSDLLLDFTQTAASQLNDDQRYMDGALPQRHPGEITAESVRQVREIIAQLVEDEKLVGRWLGQYGTQQRHCPPAVEDTSHHPADRSAPRVCLSLSVRAAFLHEDDDSATLYLDGEPWQCSLALAETLSDYRAFSWQTYTAPVDQTLLNNLFDDGLLDTPYDR